jgi:hypothetical protein
MDMTTVVRVFAGIAAIIVLVVIVWRRKKHAAE